MIIKSGGHLRSHVGGGGPEYIGDRGSRGEVAPLLRVFIGTMIVIDDNDDDRWLSKDNY